MSQSGNPPPGSEQQLDLPSLDRPRWHLWRTVLQIVAAIALISGVVQIEQRLFPSLLSEPDWLAPLVYFGAICLPLTRLFYLAALEVRCAWERARTYGELHRRAERLTTEIAELRTAATNREHLISEQRDALERLAAFVEHTHWLAPNLHRAMVVGAMFEDGRLMLIAESDYKLRPVFGDTFVVLGQEPMEILGEFGFTKMTERGYHLRAVSIQDNLWWAAVREAGMQGTLAAHQLLAILAPAPSLDQE